MTTVIGCISFGSALKSLPATFPSSLRKPLWAVIVPKSSFKLRISVCEQKYISRVTLMHNLFSNKVLKHILCVRASTMTLWKVSSARQLERMWKYMNISYFRGEAANTLSFGNTRVFKDADPNSLFLLHESAFQFCENFQRMAFSYSQRHEWKCRSKWQYNGGRAPGL